MKFWIVLFQAERVVGIIVWDRGSKPGVLGSLWVRNKIFGGRKCDLREWNLYVLGCTFFQNSRDFWKLASFIT